jgi:hypothetical protein
MTIAAVGQFPIECPKCRGAVIIEVGPTRVFNAPEVGTIVITHDQEVDCPNCRAHLGIMLAGAPGYIFKAVEVPQQKQIITPGNGLRI